MARRFFPCLGGRGAGSTSRTAQSPDGGVVAGAGEAEGQRGKGAVVVELFTSQGCATSPGADLVVSRLGRGDFGLEAPVVVLAYHVDYWDYMGWRDPYGSSQWTVRQKAYVEALGLDAIFTPLLAVQGRRHCVGTDEDALLSAIESAPRFPSPTFQATFERPSPDSLQVSLTGALRSRVDGQGAKVMVALYESGVVTECPAGENRGRVLSNDFVVRRLEKLCAVRDVSAKKTVAGGVSFGLWEGFCSEKCGVAVFVQNSAHHIFGSVSFPLPGNL